MDNQQNEILGYVPLFSLNGDADEAAQVLKGTSSLLNMLASSDGLNHKNARDCLTVLAGIIDAATIEISKGQNA